jgi:hypothetical protein
MTAYDGPADFLTPDGEHMVVSVHAGQRGDQWSGTFVLSDPERRLEQGDVCQLSADRLGDLRVIITEQRGTRRYAFVSMVTPDPFERLGPPPA